MVNLEWYRTFKAIYQNGNLTRAAEELFISQPNVSVQLAALENHVGHKLFNRLPRKLIPTEFGKMLYTQVVESIENLERVESEFRRLALKKISTIRIGSPIEYAHNYLIQELTGKDDYLYFTFGSASELVDKLEKEELDFVVATQKIDRPNIAYEPIINENFMVVCSATYNTSEFEIYLAENKLEDAEKWLVAQHWISYDNKLSLIRRFWKENFNKRPLMKPHIVIPEINSILKSVSLGQGISVVSDLLTKEYLADNRIKVLWQGDKCASNTVWLAYNTARGVHDHLDKVREMVSIKKERESV